MPVETRSRRAKQQHSSSGAPPSTTTSIIGSSTSKTTKKAAKITQSDASPSHNLRNVGPSNTRTTSSKRKRNKGGPDSDEESTEMALQPSRSDESSATKRITTSRPTHTLKKRKLSTPDNLASRFAAKPSFTQGQSVLHKRKASEEEQERDTSEPAEKRARISQSENDSIPSPGFRGLPYNLSPIHESHAVLEVQTEDVLEHVINRDHTPDIPHLESDRRSPDLVPGSASTQVQLSGEPDGFFTYKTQDLGPQDSAHPLPTTPTEPAYSRSPSLEPSYPGARSDGPSLQPPPIFHTLQPPPPARFFRSIPTLSQSSETSIGGQPSFNEFTSSQTERALRAPTMKDLDVFSQVTSEAPGSQPPMFGSFSSLHDPPFLANLPSFALSPAIGSPSIEELDPGHNRGAPIRTLTGCSSFSSLAGPSAFALLAEASPSGSEKPSIFGEPEESLYPKASNLKQPLIAASSFATTFSAFMTATERNQEADSVESKDNSSPSSHEEGSVQPSQEPLSVPPKEASQGPSLPDQDAKVHTGEENESTISQAQGRLFAFVPSDKTWINRGEGIIKLKSKDDDKPSHRLLMRQGTRVILNVALHPQINFMPMEDGRSRAFTAPDILSEGHPLQHFSIQLIGNTAPALFFDKIDECVSRLAAVF